MQSFSADVTYNAKSKTYHIRYRCPWCGENSNVAAVHGVPVPNGRVALLVVCDGNQCLNPSMVRVQHYNDAILGSTIFVEGIDPGRRASYKPEGVPEDIAADFEEALNCHASGFKLGAAVVGRRALQAALVEKGATKRDLVEQINELADDVLPRQLKVAAHHVRLIGNDAAHVRSVSANDAETLLSFVQLVLYQLYILPHELAQQARTIAPKHMPK